MPGTDSTQLTFRPVTANAAVNAWHTDHGGADELTVTCSHGNTVCTCVVCGEPSQIVGMIRCEHLIAALGAVTGRVVFHAAEDHYFIAELDR